MSDVTKSRLIAGTVQYMAPEQFEGRAIDARTDIFAFGAVLYEMVSGRKAFEGSSIGSLIAAIVERDPPALSSVQLLVPAALDRIVATCLAKDPDERLQSAHDLMRALQWVREPPAPFGATTRRSIKGLWVASVVAAAILAAIATSLWREEPSPPVQDVRFSVYPEPGSAFTLLRTSVVSPQFALSPDGRHLVYVATSEGHPRLWVRTLNALSARPLDGTEDASEPFWSPDSRSIAFFSQGKTKVVDLSGGLPVVRGEGASSGDTPGGAWAPDGTILIARSTAGLLLLASDGSMQSVFANSASGNPPLDRYPWILPDGERFVFVHRNREPNLRGIYLASLGSNARTRLTAGDWGPVAVDDHLLYLRGPALMAQQLNLVERRLQGEPVVLLKNVSGTTAGHMAASVSRMGTLAYADPWPTSGELIWFSREGRPLGSVAPLAEYVNLALSPDGSRVAFGRIDPQTGTSDVWLSELARGVTTRLTSDPMHDAGPIWSPDGMRILFRSNRDGLNQVFVKGANDPRTEELFFESTDLGQLGATDSSRDGAHVILTSTGNGSSFNVWDLPTESLRPRGILQTPFDEYQGVLSPDGRVLAYVSEETGVPQVYVQSFPNGEERVQLSSQGGSRAAVARGWTGTLFPARGSDDDGGARFAPPKFQAEEPSALFQTSGAHPGQSLSLALRRLGRRGALSRQHRACVRSCARDPRRSGLARASSSARELSSGPPSSPVLESSTMSPPAFLLGEWRVEPSLNQITRLARGSAPQRITPKAMEVLVVLTSREGQLVTRDEILASVWSDVHVQEEVLTRAIADLRKALDDDRKESSLHRDDSQERLSGRRTSRSPSLARDPQRRSLSIWGGAVLAAAAVASVLAWGSRDADPDPAVAPRRPSAHDPARSGDRAGALTRRDAGGVRLAGSFRRQLGYLREAPGRGDPHASHRSTRHGPGADLVARRKTGCVRTVSGGDGGVPHLRDRRDGRDRARARLLRQEPESRSRLVARRTLPRVLGSRDRRGILRHLSPRSRERREEETGLARRTALGRQGPCVLSRRPVDSVHAEREHEHPGRLSHRSRWRRAGEGDFRRARGARGRFHQRRHDRGLVGAGRRARTLEPAPGRRSTPAAGFRRRHTARSRSRSPRRARFRGAVARLRHRIARARSPPMRRRSRSWCRRTRIASRPSLPIRAFSPSSPTGRALPRSG